MISSDRLEDAGALILTGGCYDLTTTPPYGPWVELVRSYPTSDEMLPPLPEPLREGSDIAGIGSQAELFELVRVFFAEVSLQRPLLLVLEDLHWSDPASLELLRYLARALHQFAVLIIITYREDELTRYHPLFQLLPLITRESDALRIELQRLNPAELRNLVLARGLPEADTNRLAAYLETRTSGNPLFATELLRALEIEGVLALDGRDMWLGELDEGYMPSIVVQVIEQRLARFGVEARQALEIAAIIGEEVPLELWEAVGKTQQHVLDAAIEQAFAIHVLDETANHQGVRFTHALIREVLYKGILLTRRRIWHQRVADVLMTAPDPDPDAVAFHLEHAVDSRLVDWLARAAERALHRQAQLMAADQFDRAQALLAGDPERMGERACLLFRSGLLLRHSDFARSIRLLEVAEEVALAANRSIIAHLAREHQGLVRSFQNDVRRGLDDMSAGVLALEQIEPAGREELERLEMVFGTRLSIQGRGTLALHLTIAGQFQGARKLLENWPEKEWERSPDAFRAAGRSYAVMGQPQEARQAMTRSRNMYEALGDLGQAGVDALDLLMEVQIPYAADNIQERHDLVRATQALWMRDTSVQMPDGPEHYSKTAWAFEYYLSGDWDRADEMLHRLDDPSYFIKASRFTPLRLQLTRHRGDLVAGREKILRYLPHGPATDPGTCRYPVLAAFQPFAAEIALDAGQIEQARAWLEANDRLLQWSGAVLGRAENQLLWARFHRLVGETAMARQHADRALTHATEPRQPLALIAAHRVLGELAVQARQYADADQHLQTSLDLVDACDAPFERALTLLEFARLRAAQRQTDAAQKLLDEVRAICEPLKAQPTLDQVTTLEAELADRSDELPFGLTPRELEVLQLVAEGLTDPEVAERLFVSPRTVSSHLTAVYTKLGVNSRTAATRLAVEQHLL